MLKQNELLLCLRLCDHPSRETIYLDKIIIMHIQFNTLRLSNFLSYGKTVTEISLNSHHSTLFLGESGSGKSSIPNALSFVLFDDTFRSIKKGQLVNSVNEKNCLVEVDFEIGSDQYTIKRGIRPNILEVSKNGNSLGKDSKVTDLQNHIEKDILKFDKKTFHQIISLAEVNFVPFMQLEAKDRRTFVEKVLGVEVFSIMNALLRTKIRETEQKISELISEGKSIKEKIEIHEQYVEKKKNENKLRLKELRTEIADLESKKENLHEEIEKIKEEELKPVVESLEGKEEVEKKFEDVRNQLTKISSKKSTYLKKKSLLKENDKCPTCERDFPKEHVQEALNKINEKLEELEELSGRGSLLKEKIANKLLRFEKFNQKLQDIRVRVGNKSFSIKQYTANIDRLERQAERLKDLKEESIQEITNEIEKLNGQVSQLEIDEAIQNDIKVIQNTAIQLLKDDGIKAEIVRKYIPKINIHTNRFLNTMSFDVSFYLNEEFEEEIKTRGKESFSYNSFSAGQRQRIDLALLFTWRSIAKSRNSITTNLLFLDEVLDSHLNVEATEAVIEMFDAPIFKGTNIFVISHKKDIMTKFSKTLQFELKNGFTRIF